MIKQFPGIGRSGQHIHKDCIADHKAFKVFAFVVCNHLIDTKIPYKPYKFIK